MRMYAYDEFNGNRRCMYIHVFNTQLHTKQNQKKKIFMVKQCEMGAKRMKMQIEMEIITEGLLICNSCYV